MENLSSEATYRKFQESWRRAVRRHPDLTAGQKVVLLALQEYQNHETRTAWPKVETLMADCNLGERAVRSATSKALKVGLLVKVASGQNVRESGNTANVWAFTVPETVTHDEEGCTSVQGGVHERAGQGCMSVPPNPVLNPGMNPGTISSNRSGSKCVTVESDENGTGSADAGKDGKAVEVPGGKLTDKSVRKGSVKGDPSVTVSEGSNVKGDRRSAKRVIVESPKGDPGIPPYPVGTPDKNPSYSGGPGSADAGKDEDDSFTELLATHPKPEKSSKARHHWRAVIEEGHTPADIIAWARGYAEWAKTSEPRFVKALGGWLEARHWANQPGGVSYRKAVGEDEQRAIVAAAVLKRAETMGNPSELERLTGLSIGNEDALNVMLRDERDLLTTLIVDGLRAGKQPNSY